MRCVEDVVCFGAKLKSHTFAEAQWKTAEHRKIEIHQTRSSEYVAPGVPERILCRNGERGGIEILQNRLLADRRVSNNIRTHIATGIARIRDVAIDGDVDGKAGMDIGNAVHLPAADHVIHDMITGAQEFSAADGQVIQPVDVQIVGHVDARKATVIVEMIGVLYTAAFDTKEAVAADGDGLRPRISDGYGHAVRITVAELKLKGFITGPSPTPVEIAGRYIRKRLTRDRVAGTG